MNKLCYVAGSKQYFEPFSHLGLKLTTSITDPSKIGLIVFTGGEDVGPALYGHPNLGSYINNYRDANEVKLFDFAKENNIPMAGICRGAQFLCVMAGGHLVQDITGHTQRHKLSYIDDEGITRVSPETVTSTHHQMQYPFVLDEMDYSVLAWADEPRSAHYVYKDGKIPAAEAGAKVKAEPDVVFYHNINALAIQYHPEYMSEESWGFKYAQRLATKHLSPLIAEREVANAS